MRLYLWKIERDGNTGYDEYSDAVVVARTAEDARLIHPDGNGSKPEEWTLYGFGTWVTPERVKATKVGTAAPELKAGTVICASFHAG